MLACAIVAWVVTGKTNSLIGLKAQCGLNGGPSPSQSLGRCGRQEAAAGPHSRGGEHSLRSLGTARVGWGGGVPGPPRKPRTSGSQTLGHSRHWWIPRKSWEGGEGPQGGSGPAERGGEWASAGSQREERVLGLLRGWLGLVETMAWSTERPSAGD
jgi:hypothetical protein